MNNSQSSRALVPLAVLILVAVTANLFVSRDMSEEIKDMGDPRTGAGQTIKSGDIVTERHLIRGELEELDSWKARHLEALRDKDFKELE